MIKLNCYEPGHRAQHSPYIRLTSDDVARHVLAIGATGSGKTTSFINPALQQLIAYGAGGGDAVGMLVLDPKADDTSQKIASYAKAAGRQDDVVVLSATADGDSFYDYFAGLQRLEQVDEFARRALFGSRDMGEANAYWSEYRFGLLSSALTLLLSAGEPITFDRAVGFLSAWFYSRDSAELNDRISFVERLLATGKLNPATQRQLKMAVVEAQNFKALDDRTREIHKSTMNNALRSLCAPAARPFFDTARGRPFKPSDVLSKKILVANIDAVRHPQLAGFLFRALKRDFYEAVLSRAVANPGQDRKCGLILDEVQLSLAPDDASIMAVLRSKGGFVFACSQGLCAIEEVLGPRRRNALLACFNTLFFFASREDQTDQFAMLALGTRERSMTSPETPFGDTQMLDPLQPTQVVPVCPPGSLARLSQHQAYLKLADGKVTAGPIWLAPQYFDYTPPRITLEEDDLAQAAASLRRADEDKALIHADVPLFMVHMHRRGHRLLLTPNILTAA